MKAAEASEKIGTVYGAKNGIQGVLNDTIVNLEPYCNDYNIALLQQTPAMALGSCRCKLTEEDYPRIAEIFNKYEIGYFFYIGGNDSMDTVAKLGRYFKENNMDICAVGVPKTIDNDLPVTDHTPGFGSAAKYLYHSISEIIRDSHIYPVDNVVIVEIMGRDSGWLTLASGLPRFLGNDTPDIIAIPEVAFDENKFLEKIRDVQKEKHTVVCVVSEGIRDGNGSYVGQDAKSGAVDTFGHAYLSGIGKYLEGLVARKIGCKVRSIELNVLQRCASHLASKTDLDEAFAAGCKAVELAENGESGVMVTMLRASSNPYRIEYSCTDVNNVANKAKDIPERWFNLYDESIYPEITEYLLPLIKGSLEHITDDTGLPKYIDIR